MAALETIFGKNWRTEKREWREMQARVKTLPADYQETFKAIQKYAFATGLVANDWQRFADLLELFEVSSLEGNAVQDFIGADVAGFADEFFGKADKKDWLDKKRQALNDYFAKR